MSGLRERGKTRRRAEIVAAASTLWRAHGIDQVTLLDVAAAAQVAPQTLHNLIGTHEALASTVVDELLDRLDAGLAAIDTTRGVDRAIQAALLSASLFIADPALYRQLVVRIPRSIFAGERGPRDNAGIQIDALRRAQRDGDLRGSVNVELAGRTIFRNYLGALYTWGAGGISDSGFTAAAELAALSTLAACATASAAPALQDRLDGLLARAADGDHDAA